MKTAYRTAFAAVTRSITHDEVGLVVLEDYTETSRARVLQELEACGLEDYTVSEGDIDAWGEQNGRAWRVRSCDGLTHTVMHR